MPSDLQTSWWSVVLQFVSTRKTQCHRYMDRACHHAACLSMLTPCGSDAIWCNGWLVSPPFLGLGECIHPGSPVLPAEPSHTVPTPVLTSSKGPYSLIPCCWNLWPPPELLPVHDAWQHVEGGGCRNQGSLGLCPKPEGRCAAVHIELPVICL